MRGQTITIVTVGTRGDVHPYVALGLGLQAAGYRVRLAAPAAFSELIERYGLTALPIRSVDPNAFLGRAGVQGAAQRSAPVVQLTALLREARPMMKGLVEEVWNACQGSDAVIASTIFYGAQDSAEALRVPCIHTFLHPLLPTRTVPNLLMPRLPVSLGSLNRQTYAVVNQLLWQAFRPVVNAFRRRLGLEPWSVLGPYRVLHDPRSLLLFGFSPVVFPKPHDWPAHAHVTGHWFLGPPADWRPPTGLVEFLERGPKPVYIGFGSMAARYSSGDMQVIADATVRAGQRAVMAGAPNHQAQNQFRNTVLPISSVPHSWLFPRTAAVVHHGGAGTTAEGLRAGVPPIIVPFLGDQHYWGERVAELGVGPKPIRYHELTAEGLADRILRAVSEPGMRARAHLLGEEIGRENGVRNAVRLIDQYLEGYA